MKMRSTRKPSVMDGSGSGMFRRERYSVIVIHDLMYENMHLISIFATNCGATVRFLFVLMSIVCLHVALVNLFTDTPPMFVYHSTPSSSVRR